MEVIIKELDIGETYIYFSDSDLLFILFKWK